MPQRVPVRRARRPSVGLWGNLRRLIVALLVLVFIVQPIWVLIYRFVPPPITELMVERSFEGYGLHHDWTPLSQISPAMVRAVIASEDARFCEHNGFDVQAIDKALKHNEAKPGHIRGGSTISQQTAKNVFLWPERSWLRKGAEAWFTLLIENIWGKPRIMEVYLNTVEMGPGVYGVQAASQIYFHTDAANLNAEQASRVAAILPSPLKWKAEAPGPYVRRRTDKIDARSATVSQHGLAACVLDHKT
jgi:monofunctional biosynthetic peptidoglycan transglycosylase